MQIVYDMSKLLDVADDGLSICDKDREEYRLTVWEEDGVLHVMFYEPVVIATQEDDVIGGRYRIPRGHKPLPTFADMLGIYKEDA